MKTAEELLFINDFIDRTNCNKVMFTNDAKKMMIEFAKMHVLEALTTVHTNFMLPKEYLEYTLSYYPLENIK